MKNPLVSIIIPTRNNHDRIEHLLKLLKKQSYSNIELIISDALSNDGTREIAKKYGAKIIDNAELLAEPGVTIGMSAASGDVLMVLAVDNYFYNSEDLEKIVRVFDNPQIFAAFPKHESKKNYSIYSKYINTFTDPFNHFVYGYAANARTFKKVYSTLENNDSYDVYDFSSSAVKPILAFAQGFTIRKGYMRDMNDSLDDIMPILKMITERRKIAYIHCVNLFHDTIRDTQHFLRKMEWAASNALTCQNYGISKRESTLTGWQKFKKVLFPIYALSFVFPSIVAIYFASTEKKIIWLFHPIITFITGYAIIKQILIKSFGFTPTISRL